MTLLAGAATADISPRKPVPLFGYPHAARISTGIHDPLLASALYLANGDQAAVLLSLDLLFIEPPVARRIRARVARACTVQEACVFIGCTHTHSGPISSRILAWQDDPAAPEPDAGYLEAVAEHAAEAAAAARKRAVPARLAWTSADATGVGGNRRRPDGPTDPECGILAVRHAADDSPWLAVVLIYGMHPTVLHEDSTLVSADFPYAARVHLREHLRADMPVIHFTAPCGDQSPRWFVKEQSFREAERLGRMLGAAALAGIRSVDGATFSAEALIAGSLRTVSLVRRRHLRKTGDRCACERTFT
ncbi:MAG TPA: neutral/alkaline non-lysosomal ceramidase N-terminal domain-containing protein [Planctomycetota bacterium]|nr:neutral/alkaline non-lysosomal ceramidase N-terminal domain-containing protein [Planctomycetota bacterium]